jgi:hypothetical protein
MPLSSGVMNPIGRLGGSGGAMSWLTASISCLSWLRVLRLKVSCVRASGPGLSFLSREARAPRLRSFFCRRWALHALVISRMSCARMALDLIP